MSGITAGDNRSSRLWQGYFLVGIALIVTYYLNPSSAGATLIYDGFGCAAIVATVWGIRRYRPTASGTWYVLASGIALLSAGDLVWTYNELIRHVESPFPSVADYLYLGAYPVFATALVVFRRRRAQGSDRGTIIDAGIIGLSYGLTAWVFFLEPYLRDSAYPIVERLVSAAYPGMDIIVIGALALLLLSVGARSPAFLLLIGGTTIYVSADVFYAKELLAGTYGDGSWLDAAWMLGALCWGAAGLHPSMRDLARPAARNPIVLSRRRIALLAVVALAVPVLTLLPSAYGDATNRYIFGATTAVLFLLVVLRLSGLVQTLTARESRFRSLVQHGADLIAVVDADGAIQWVSESVGQILGYESSDLIGRSSLDLVCPADMARVRDALTDCANVPGSQCSIEVRVIHADGSERIVDATMTNQLNQPEVGGVIVNARDVTSRKQVDATLRSVQVLNTSIVESSIDGIFTVDENGRLTGWNPAMEQLTGLSREQVLGSDLIDRFPYLREVGEDALVIAALQGKSGKGVTQPNLIATTQQNGFFEALYAPLRSDAGDVSGALAVVRDVTAQKHLEADLAYRAFHDVLTGLPNRVLFADRLRQALRAAARRGEPIAVLMLDMDRFKLINDGLGHAAGDQVLKSVAQRLQTCLREADTVARLGGDEFIVLLDGTPASQALEIGNRILSALMAPLPINGRVIYPGASIGIAISTPDLSAEEELIRTADIALYRAKAAGRKTIIVFDPSTTNPTDDWLALEDDLRSANTRDELVLYYQPVVDLTDGRVVNVEALVRWQHPVRGLLFPSAFIPLAEETGLITTITSWAIAEACRQIACWSHQHPECAPPTVSVNLTTRDLRDPALCERIEGALATWNLSPHVLRLEITEHVLIEEIEAAADTLSTLRSIGIGLSIDDFGAGASSLASLRAIDVEVLKLDRSFIQGMAENSDNRVVVEAVAAMAHKLDMTVTAEGIETVEQYQLAKSVGCDRGQGFLFSRALPPDQLMQWLHNHDKVTAKQLAQASMSD